MRENGHVTEVASLMEGKWSCYRVGQFHGGSMVMLQSWPVTCREMQGEWSCYRGGHFNGETMVMLQKHLFNGGGMVMLERWPV